MKENGREESYLPSATCHWSDSCLHHRHHLNHHHRHRHHNMTATHQTHQRQDSPSTHPLPHITTLATKTHNLSQLNPPILHHSCDKYRHYQQQAWISEEKDEEQGSCWTLSVLSGCARDVIDLLLADRCPPLPPSLDMKALFQCCLFDRVREASTCKRLLHLQKAWLDRWAFGRREQRDFLPGW